MKREQRNEMCKRCGKYRAIYQYHGGPVRRRRDHDYCPKCWRGALNSVRLRYKENLYEPTPMADHAPPAPDEFHA